MIVTDLKYHLENRLVSKLDIMVHRITNKTSRKDAVFICEGAEGEGKTNSSEAIAYYIKYKTGRDIHMFFKLNTMIEFAKSTENKIIIWDEPSLDSLSVDWAKEINKNLLRLLMTCRKKRHFFILNFTKFYKFSEYVVVDRAIGMIHMYSRNNTLPGRFMYIKKGSLEFLYNSFRFKKKRDYKGAMAFGGSMPIVEKYMDKMGINIEGVPNCNLEQYEELKDKAIASIGQKKRDRSKHYQNLQIFKKRIGYLKCPIMNHQELAEQLGVSRRSFYLWQKITLNIEKKPEIYPIPDSEK